MFRQVQVPVLGVVENMSYFIGDDGKRYEIFRHGGGRKLADESGLPFLGEIPIDPRVAECGDAASRSCIATRIPPVAKAYLALADNVDRQLRQAEQPKDLPEVQL